MTLLVVAVVIAVQCATGAVWWWWAVSGRRDTMSGLELIGVGTALGTFGSMLSAVLLAGHIAPALAWLLPTALTVVLLAVRRPHLTATRLTVPRWEAVAAGVGLVIGLVLTIINWRRIPLDDPLPSSFTDLFFFEALGRGLSQWGPGESILMDGGSLRYHWFSYAWAGQLEQLSSAQPFLVLTRVLPLVVLAGVATLVAGWAGRLSRVRWVPTLAVLLVVAGGYAGGLYGTVLNYDSPSQSMTTLWLLAFALAFLGFTVGDTGRWSLLIVAAAAAACTGGKISHALVAAGGAAVVTIVGLLTRQLWWRRALLASAVAAVAMAATYVLVLAGVAVDRNLTEEVATKASTWQGLDPFAGRLGVALGTGALVLAILARVAGVGWLLRDSRGRRDPQVLFAVGGLLVGLAAMLLLSEGVNELWFVLAASAPAAVLSAHGSGQALRTARRRAGLSHPLVLAGAVAVPASVVCLALSRNWASNQSVLNWLAPISAWLLVPAGAALVSAVWARRGSRVLAFVAISLAGIVFTSILTRPSSLWTSSRPVTTVGGTITPSTAAGQSGVVTAASGGATVYADAADAADWLRENLPDDAVLATGWPVSALVPALTGQQMFIAGDLYQVGLGSADERATVEQRSTASRAFGDAPSLTTVAPLCASGVEWVWIDRAIDSIPGVAEVAYANATTSIIRLLPEACS